MTYSLHSLFAAAALNLLLIYYSHQRNLKAHDNQISIKSFGKQSLNLYDRLSGVCSTVSALAKKHQNSCFTGNLHWDYPIIVSLLATKLLLKSVIIQCLKKQNRQKILEARLLL